MKKLFAVLTVTAVLGLSGFMMAGACDSVTEAAEGLCGDCGKVSNGDATITGMAELDGVFKAVGTLKMSTGAIKGDFDARVRAIAEGVFDIDVTGMSTADMVAAIETAFDAQITAYVEGGLKVTYQAPKCEADVNVAVSAQAQCEAKVDASCSADVECTGGEVSFECSGKCEGSCSGTCSVPSCTVSIDPGGAECSGSCQGSCSAELTAAAACDGKCEGSCDGKCSAYVENADGEMECAGSCDGNCQGSCTVEGSAAVECSGTCKGECKLEGPEAEAQCTGELGCSGECDAECSGSCQGEVTAPKCEGHAECNADASAKCEAQASAQASASLKCSPPSLSIDFNWDAGADAEAKASVMAKLEKFKTEMVAILQGTAKLRALVDADYAASIGIDPPTVTIKASVDTFLSALSSGDIEVEAPGLVPCAIPAFQESASILTNAYDDMKNTIALQLKMAALLDLDI